MSERLAFGSGRVTAPSRGTTPAAADSRPLRPAGVGPDLPPAARKPPRERTDWAFVGLMLFTALLYFRPQDTIKPLAVLPLAEFAALGGLAAMVYSRITRGKSLTRVTPELLGVLALAGVIVLTAPFSIWPGGAIQTFTNMYLKVMLIFILMVNTLTSQPRILRFTWLLVIATSYIAFRAVFDYARGFNLVENGRVQGAVGGMFMNPNDLALNMVAILPIAVLLVVRRGAIPGRVFAAAGAFLMIGATIVSQSRSGFLGLAAMMLFLTLQIGRKRPAFLAASALALVMALPLVPSSYWERVSSITDESLDATGSRQARRVLLAEAYETFLDHPLTGVGAGLFQAYDPKGRAEAWRETHNVVLQVASELGIFGLIVFMYLVWRGMFAGRQTRQLLRRAAGAVKKRPWSRAPAAAPVVISRAEADFIETQTGAMTAAMAGWFFSALFASVAYHWTFYYLLALAVAPRDLVAERIAAVAASEGEAVGTAAALREVRA